jgi:hypothetical protein
MKAEDSAAYLLDLVTDDSIEAKLRQSVQDENSPYEIRNNAQELLIKTIQTKVFAMNALYLCDAALSLQKIATFIGAHQQGNIIVQGK